ncbi:MAG: hypothetical protein K0S32_4370 [Bacteroidetes bacterium]|jgi:hypothetical protein|nr:hypothetical protein [Bacteroidota bacterium]
MVQKELWDKIKDFELDDPEIALSFSDRLARENGWSLEYSLRAIHEYKKFIYMLCIADHPLTPSDQVDQAWHLHLLYTESYWIDLCKNTLHKQIHHGPTKGGKSEGEKYNDLYERTLALYSKEFGKKAPADIWPDPKIRFSEINFQRVNLNRNWVIKKPKLK